MTCFRMKDYSKLPKKEPLHRSLRYRQDCDLRPSRLHDLEWTSRIFCERSGTSEFFPYSHSTFLSAIQPLVYVIFHSSKYVHSLHPPPVSYLKVSRVHQHRDLCSPDHTLGISVRAKRSAGRILAKTSSKPLQACTCRVILLPGPEKGFGVQEVRLLDKGPSARTCVPFQASNHNVGGSALSVVFIYFKPKRRRSPCNNIHGSCS